MYLNQGLVAASECSPRSLVGGRRSLLAGKFYNGNIIRSIIFSMNLSESDIARVRDVIVNAIEALVPPKFDEH